MDITFTIIAQALAFAGLIWLVATKIWPPLLHAITERQERISESLAAADRSAHELQQAQAQVQELLKDARAQAHAIIEQAHARAQQIIDESHAQAVAATTRQKAQAQAEIDAQVLQAREALRQHIGALVVCGAEKVLKREIDVSAHQNLIDDLVAEI